jgi:hypothetical protein
MLLVELFLPHAGLHKAYLPRYHGHNSMTPAVVLGSVSGADKDFGCDQSWCLLVVLVAAGAWTREDGRRKLDKYSLDACMWATATAMADGDEEYLEEHTRRTGRSHVVVNHSRGVGHARGTRQHGCVGDMRPSDRDQVDTEAS